MGLIDPARVRASVDIVEVIGGSVPLKRRGRTWWGCCPFHGEKSPSFQVRPDPHADYKCFGCGEHGDVISFIRKTQGCSFREACAYLGFEGEEQRRYDDPMDDPVLRDLAYGKTAVAYREYREECERVERLERARAELEKRNPEAVRRADTIAEAERRRLEELAAAERARYWPRQEGTAIVRGVEVPRFVPGEGQNVLGAAEMLGFRVLQWQEKGQVCAVVVTGTGIELPCRRAVLPSELGER